MKVSCKTCGKYFDKKPSQVKRSKNHYCSKGCTITSVSIPCESCGKIIKRERNQLKGKRSYYCSKKCFSSKRTGKTVQCKGCGGNLYRTGARLLQKNNFCNNKCKSKFFRKNYIVTCVVCGNEFEKVPAEQRRHPVHCCSVECRSKNNDKRVEVSCTECGKKFERPLSVLYGKANYFCSQECHNDFQNHKTLVKCDSCGIDVWKSPSAMADDFNHHFCSVACFSKFEHKDNYVEVEFEKMIMPLSIEYTRNDRVILKEKAGNALELDFYFPSIRFAVEINGSTHYKPIYGEESLAIRKARDKRKRKICKKLGIKLRSIRLGDCKKKTYIPRYKRVIYEIEKRLAELNKETCDNDTM